MIHVLGASGRLGQMLQWAWQQRTDVTWHSGRTSGNLLNPPEGLSAILRSAEVIVNLSGITPAEGADLNLNTSLALAAFSLAPHARILTASSAAVYGMSDNPLAESASLKATTQYGLSKIAMERAIHDQESGRQHTILRIGNVAGADQLLGGLGSEKPYLHCFSDNTSPQRSYIGPRGLADAIGGIIVASQTWPREINVASSLVSMGALLRAADRDYSQVIAPKSLPRKIELDLARLKALCPKLNLAQSPSDIIAEWRVFQDSRVATS